VIQAVIFDLDDTLYDEMQFVKGGFEAVSSYISKNSGVNQNTVYQLLLDVLEKYGRGKIFDIALKKLGLYNEKLIPKLVEIYRKHIPNLILYPDAETVLYTLRKRGYKLGLMTDGNVEVQRNKVKALKIGDFFDCIVFSDEYGVEKRKPNPLPYQKAIKRLKIEPKEAFYVGDNPYKDFITAKKMGMVTVRILRGEYKNTNVSVLYDADHSINDLSEILKLIKINSKRKM